MNGALVAHRHAHARLVALVGDFAIGVFGKGGLVHPAAGKQVIAHAVLRVGQAEHLVAQAAHFNRQGLPVRRGQRVVGRLQGYFFDAKQQVADAL